MSQRPSAPSKGPAPFAWPQVTALVAGFVVLMIGLVGFWPTSFDQLAPGDSPATVLGVEVYPLRNVLHVVLGLLGMLSATRLPGTRIWGGLLAAAEVVFVVFGVIGVAVPAHDYLGMNIPAIVLAVVLALAGLVLAAAPVRRGAPFFGTRVGES